MSLQSTHGHSWIELGNLSDHVQGLWSETGNRVKKSLALTGDGRYFVGPTLDEESQR